MGRIKDYHKKRYSNPFFDGRSGRRRRSRTNKQRGSWRNKIILFFLIILLGAVIYFIFYSPYFEIKEVNVSGLERINYDEMRGVIENQMSGWRLLFFKQNNIFIFDEKAAENVLSDKYILKLCNIDKRLPGTMIVSVEERNPALFWKTGERYYVVDWDGTIIREISSEEISGYPPNQSGAKMALVFDESNTGANLREEILSSEIVKAISGLQNNLAGETELAINNFSMTKESDTAVKASTSEGWQIYFSLTNDLNAQIDKLKAFLMEKGPEDRQGLQYVDLRFSDRIYYK